MGVPFLGSIPLNAQVVTGGDDGKPFYANASIDDSISEKFTAIVDNISAEVKKRN